MKLSQIKDLSAIDLKSFAIFFVVDSEVEAGADASTDNFRREEIKQTAEILYRDLQARGLKVAMDDRAVSCEEKRRLAEDLRSDFQLVLSAATMKSGYVTLKFSTNQPMKNLNVEDTPDILADLAKQN